MIISKTPYRISFFGGGTDYPEWFLEEGGAVLSTTIDKYCYVSCRFLPPFFNIRHRVVWSHIETVSTISEILHPAVREGLRFLGFDDSVGLEIHHQGDLPSRSGIGSSSSFTVGLIKALTALRGQSIGRHELALRAIHLERDVLREKVGCQDQAAAAYGGFNVITFSRDKQIEVNPIRIPPEKVAELESRLLLIYAGATRLASEIASNVIASLKKKQSVLREMRSMVSQAVSILSNNGSFDEFGRLMHHGWMLKRELSAEVTSPLVDGIYKKAIDHGALGGKLLGAGGAGFMVFYVAPQHKARVIEALSGFLHVPFKFENEGSSVIYNQENSRPYL